MRGRATPALPRPVSDPPPVRIEVVPGTAHPAWPEVLALRGRVFGDEQGIAEARGSDPDDGRSLHALAWLPAAGAGAGRVLAGTGRITLRHNGRNEALIAWVATAPAFRGAGIGAAIVGALLAEADAAGIDETLLAAQRHAEGFYARLGFFAVGTPYLVHGIPHRWMVRPRRR